MPRPRGSGGRSAYDKYRRFQKNWTGRSRGTGGKFTKNGSRKTYSKFDKPRASNGRYKKSRFDK